MSVRSPARLPILILATLVVMGSGGWLLSAQEQAVRRPEAKDSATSGAARVSLEEALTRPFTFPFRDETTLETVAKHLQNELGAQVVLDIAALKRLELVPADHVQLDLKNVRLKTGLKLLLDQVGLTYKIIPEDNLLVFTDERGVDDPTSRILEELKELHRDIHNIQDAVDDLSRNLAPGDNPAFRKPTIIEEVPADRDHEKPREKGKADEPVGRSRPGL